MKNPHDMEGFSELTEDEQRIRLIEYTVGCHKETLNAMKKTEGFADVSVQVLAREVAKLERSLAELKSR